jgi:2'-5' RNA ligase
MGWATTMGEDVGVVPVAFERLSARGREAVLSGDHGYQGDPAETGRWGPSVVLFPGDRIASDLDRLTSEVMDVAGAGHWPSGGLGRAHLTIRALEPYVTSIPDDRAARYLEAMRRALADVSHFSLDLIGVGLAPDGVIACATSPDGGADRLRERLEEELGEAGWLERAAFENGRDPIWYCTLVHFAAPIDDPEALVAWVDEHTEVEVGSDLFDSISLCRWSHDGQAMSPSSVVSLASSG